MPARAVILFFLLSYPSAVSAVRLYRGLSVERARAVIDAAAAATTTADPITNGGVTLPEIRDERVYNINHEVSETLLLLDIRMATMYIVKNNNIDCTPRLFRETAMGRKKTTAEHNKNGPLSTYNDLRTLL